MTDNISSNAIVASRDGPSGALFNVEGTIARNATWAEDIYFYENGVGLDISLFDWKITLRADPEQDSADFTASISDGLTIVSDNANVSSILRISVPPADISGLRGDYVIDIASQATDLSVICWAHGTISMTRNPVTWS